MTSTRGTWENDEDDEDLDEYGEPYDDSLLADIDRMVADLSLRIYNAALRLTRWDCEGVQTWRLAADAELSEALDLDAELSDLLDDGEATVVRDLPASSWPPITVPRTGVRKKLRAMAQLTDWCVERLRVLDASVTAAIMFDENCSELQQDSSKLSLLRHARAAVDDVDRTLVWWQEHVVKPNRKLVVAQCESLRVAALTERTNFDLFHRFNSRVALRQEALRRVSS